MAWDFTTEPEFQEKLDWATSSSTTRSSRSTCSTRGDFYPLDDELRADRRPAEAGGAERGLWAAHLGPELGGQGYGQLKLALLNEILGTSAWAPIVFGTQAPDTGNAEIIAHYGTRRAEGASTSHPLLEGDIVSCYSMTEPQGGADPRLFTTRAERDGDEWVINGEKYFSSNARTGRASSSSWPSPTPTSARTRACRCSSSRPTPPGSTSCGTPASSASPRTRACTPSSTTTTCGCRPRACSAARARRSPSPRPGSAAGGCTTPCGRWGRCQRALDMMCERVLVAGPRGRAAGPEAGGPGRYRRLLRRAAAVPPARHLHRLADRPVPGLPAGAGRTSPPSRCSPPRCSTTSCCRAMHIHGALGVSNEMPLGGMWTAAPMHERRGRADRGAQGHRRPRGAEGLPPAPRPVADRAPARGRGRRRGASWPSTSSTSSETPERAGGARCTQLRAARGVSVEEVPDPVAGTRPGRGHDVAAAAVNYPDVLLVVPIGTRCHVAVPFTPGSEFAGTVRSVGPDVDGVRGRGPGHGDGHDRVPSPSRSWCRRARCNRCPTRCRSRPRRRPG